MRKKEKHLIAAFYTTHDAMAFEEFCLAHNVPGRLIPLPGEISAGCGLAWSTRPDQRESLPAHLSEAGITPQHLVLVEV